MDLLSRLVGGSGASTPKKTSASPSERLTSFKRTANSLQQLWRNGASLADEDTASLARSYLLRLNSILDEESRSAAPYPCLIYAASSQLYIIITKLALSSQNAGIVSTAARFFDILIHGEAEGILDNQLFARALVDLVRKTAGPGFVPLRKGEGDLIELLFGVANKIRLDPEILPAWFYPDRAESREDAGEKGAFAGATRQNTFPLFYCLVEYVYHDGRTGDFARTGLLYLTETASKSKRLEKWMIESDLATLMASGLGALYSRLSRSLPTADEDNIAPILALSDHAPLTKPSDPTDFHSNIDAFLSFLLFWQDTLDHCGSQEVNDTLLDHFQVLFLEQLLYPSLLESSDVDGGSTASLITYLVQILESLDHTEMIQRILDYLLAAPGERPKSVKGPKKNPRMSLSRRKSLDVLNAMAEADNNPSPDLFNLVDLISMSLRSKHTQTTVATLRLLTVILRRHHSFAFESLFKVSKRPKSWLPRTIMAVDECVEGLFESAQLICEDKELDRTFNDLLTDVAGLLEGHTCYKTSLALRQWPSDDATLQYQSPMMLASDEFLVRRLVELLEKFFTNDVLTNLALTEAITSLSSCYRLGLENWLLDGSTEKNHVKDYDDSISSTLKTLMAQIRQWQKEFPEWETLLKEQKGRLMDQSISEPLLSTKDQKPSISTPAHTPLHSKKRSVDLGAQMLDAYSDSVSPRGRNLPQRQVDEVAAPTSSSPLAPTSKSKMHLASPLRRAQAPPMSREPSSPSRSPSPIPDQLRKQIILENQSQRTSSVRAVERLRRAPDSSPAPSSGTVTPLEVEDEPLTKTVSLSHVLTNAIILQQFVLELAAVVQTRASLFEEVRFD